MKGVIVAGIGTGVGKTLTAAILTVCLQGAYWKPIQTGIEEGVDPDTVRELIASDKYPIFPSAYSLQARLSPHHAAKLENISISLENIVPPQTHLPLIIESVGGILVPLNNHFLSFDLFRTWNMPWIVISQHYLGSINHTLLTLEVLKRNQISVAGVIFNGHPNQESESAILGFAQVQFAGRLLPESKIYPETIQWYAKQWQTRLSQIL